MKEVSTSEFWNNRYQENNTAWDIGKPTPILTNYLKINKKKEIVCVLGCGNGHDVLEFSKFENEVYGVDFSEEAINNLNNMSKERQLRVNLVIMDIFDLPTKFNDFFDLVYEYTCFCAIDPTRRCDYFDTVFKILKPGGLLFGIFIPLDKDENNIEGPPFGVEINKIKELTNDRFIVVDEYFSKLSIEPRMNREKVMILQKIRS